MVNNLSHIVKIMCWRFMFDPEKWKFLNDPKLFYFALPEKIISISNAKIHRSFSACMKFEQIPLVIYALH